MSYSRNDLVPRDLVPMILALVVPLAMCVVIILHEPGIERSFLWTSIMMAVILTVIGLALSFAASRLAARNPDSAEG
jgi:hypothetical protein